MGVIRGGGGGRRLADEPATLFFLGAGCTLPEGRSSVWRHCRPDVASLKQLCVRVPACAQDKIVLRYEAVLEPAAQGGSARLIAIDRERKFVVSFFLADQTLAVFEPPRPNRCRVAGKGPTQRRADQQTYRIAQGGCRLPCRLPTSCLLFYPAAASLAASSWSAARCTSTGTSW